ncbi:ABC transporter ATP-binding protein [Corynebacterium cystitidis]|uniref:ABC transporter ATP-binding protein n=1 Tax=Corynebacterium cystitidis TaxID=35757 RepID=UPI00211E5B8A|nr:ABC transporter ATP-binding protein [Corynebacterium cystitidis]
MKLQVQGLSFAYRGVAQVLFDVDFGALPGQVTALIGPNGCGKTTAAKCINRILEPKTGTIRLGDHDLRRTSRPSIGRLVGYVPQSSATVSATSVIEFLLLGRRQLLQWRLRAEDLDEVFSVLQRLNIVELANQRVSELSGGQRQKVLIARALMQQPALFLFDEPTSALDIRNQLEIMELARVIAWREKKTVVLVLHDLSMALNYADHVVMLADGHVVAAGGPSEVITSDLVRQVYGVDVTVDNNGGASILNPFSGLKSQPPS